MMQTRIKNSKNKRKKMSKEAGDEYMQWRFFVVPLHFFGSTSTISCFRTSTFVMVSTVWSVSCLLFFDSRCPAYPAVCKSGGHVTQCWCAYNYGAI